MAAWLRGSAPWLRHGQAGGVTEESTSPEGGFEKNGTPGEGRTVLALAKSRLAEDRLEVFVRRFDGREAELIDQHVQHRR